MNNFWETINDIGHYGIFDEPECFYPNCREQLEKDLACGCDFNTGWHGFKKEPQSIHIFAEGDAINVEVNVFIDDMPDLIYDCDGGEDLTEEQIDEVYDAWCGTLYTTEVNDYGRLPRDASLQDILDLACYLAANCSEELDEGFRFLQDTVKEVIK